MKLYAACFWYEAMTGAGEDHILTWHSPFSQRVWIALEAKGMSYQYCEIDPYRRPAPTQFLEANPAGLTPAIRQGEWACSESGVILEYVRAIAYHARLSLTNSFY